MLPNLKSHTELDLHRWGLFLRNIFILRNFIWLWFWLNIRLLRRNVRLLTLRFWGHHAASACLLTAPCAIWVRVSSVFFSSASVASSNRTASFRPSSPAHDLSVPYRAIS